MDENIFCFDTRVFWIDTKAEILPKSSYSEISRTLVDRPQMYRADVTKHLFPEGRYYHEILTTDMTVVRFTK